MVIALYRLARPSQKNRVHDPKDDVVKVREMLKRLFHPVRHAQHRHTEACRQTECDKEAEQKLHDMAARLHVLEWEAYGHPKKRTEPK